MYEENDDWGVGEPSVATGNVASRGILNDAPRRLFSLPPKRSGRDRNIGVFEEQKEEGKEVKIEAQTNCLELCHEKPQPGAAPVRPGVRPGEAPCEVPAKHLAGAVRQC